MAAELEAILTANIKDLKSKLQQAEKALDDYGKEVDNQAGKGAKGFTKVGKGAANAIPAVQEFSRVIQDAPYGIQGVGNNIQQLTANFGNLSRSAGGAVPALKLMVSSLAGPAGLLLAVSAVTSLLTVYSGSLGKSKTEAEKLAETQKKMAESLNQYRESLAGVNRARLEGNSSAAEELVQLKLLRVQIENTNNSLELRKDAIRQLQKEYPTYFKNVKEEALLNGSLKTTYDKLTESILKRAKATAASDLLVANAKKEIALRQQLVDLNKKYGDDLVNQSDIISKVNTRNKTGAGKLVGINKQVNKGYEEQIEIIKQLGEITKENQKLTAFVEANIAIDPNIDIPKDTTEKIKNKFKNLDSIFGITDSVQKTLDNFKPDFEGFEVKMNKLGDIVGFALSDSVSKIKPQLSQIESSLVEFNEGASRIINDGIANTFASIGTAIGNGLVNGGKIGDQLAKALLGSVGGMLIELGTMAIGIGIGIEAIQTALKSLNPYIAVAAGVALIALGASFSAGANKIGSSGGGSSSVSGQGSSGSGTRSFSSTTSGSFSGDGSVVFEIRGTSLVGVLKNTLDGNSRLGGNLSLG